MYYKRRPMRPDSTFGNGEKWGVTVGRVGQKLVGADAVFGDDGAFVEALRHAGEGWGRTVESGDRKSFTPLRVGGRGRRGSSDDLFVIVSFYNEIFGDRFKKSPVPGV